MVFTLVRDIPAYAAFFGSYSVIKENVKKKSQFPNSNNSKKNEKGDIFISLKNELKKLDFNDWNSSLIAGQGAN